MSFFTQAKQKRSFGRSFLTPNEVSSHTPWYAGKVWQDRKDRIAQRVAKKVEASRDRKRIREIQASLALKKTVKLA